MIISSVVMSDLQYGFSTYIVGFSHDDFNLHHWLLESLENMWVRKPEFSVVPSNGKYVLIIKFATPKVTIDQLIQFSIPPYLRKDKQPTKVAKPGAVFNLLLDADNE